MLSAGINDFVSKPFDPKELFAKIATYTRGTKNMVCSSAIPLAFSSQIDTFAPAGTSISLSKYRNLTLDNQKELSHLLELSIRDFTDFKKASLETVQKGDMAGFEKLAHKNKTIITLLEADKLGALVKQVEDNWQPNDSLHWHNITLALQREIDVVIKDLQGALNAVE
jgi:CheY-like chemotaxis protein